MPYLLDSNTFIEAKNQYYRFSFCPGYWEWILRANNDGRVFSIDRIRDELTDGNDDLADWAKNDASQLFVNAPNDVSSSMTLVSDWVSSQRYKPAAISTFLARADYYLIAYAHALEYVVVTRETEDSRSIKRVKIPDVCKAVGVKCVDPFQMLEDEKASFVCNT